MPDTVKRILLNQGIAALCVLSVGLPIAWTLGIFGSLPSGRYPILLFYLPAIPCFWVIRYLVGVKEGFRGRGDKLSMGTRLAAWSPSLLTAMGLGAWALSIVLAGNHKQRWGRFDFIATNAARAIEKRDLSALLRYLDKLDEGKSGGEQSESAAPMEEVTRYVDGVRSRLKALVQKDAVAFLDLSLVSKAQQQAWNKAIQLLHMSEMEEESSLHRDLFLATMRDKGIVVRATHTFDAKAENEKSLADSMTRSIVEKLQLTFPELQWIVEWPFAGEPASDQIAGFVDLRLSVNLDLFGGRSSTSLGVPTSATVGYTWDPASRRAPFESQEVPSGDRPMKHPLEDYMPKGSSRGELAWTKEMLTSEASKACEALAAEVVQMIDRSRK